MRIRITKKTRRILLLYLAVLVALYIVVFQMPKVSDKFETTQVLENGTLEVSCSAEGYIIKDEAVCVASKTGVIHYNMEDGTVVKKGTKIESIDDSQDYLDKLKGYDMLQATSVAPISGVFSLSMDGNEKYLCSANLDKIKKEKVEELDFKEIDLNREKVNEGEPIYKISNDDAWYIISWVEKADARKYEEGEKVRITIGDTALDAKVRTIKRDGEFVRMVFYLNCYYEDFCSARKVDMTVVQSNTMGLIVDNECIIEKNGQKGVYVKTKDGDTYFRPIKVKITDGKQSVIYESIYVNEKYEQVETVRVYQEVLRDPQVDFSPDLPVMPAKQFKIMDQSS